MFVKVPFTELSGLQSLEYSLYAISGELRYRAGQTVNADLLANLQVQSLYRDTGDIPKTDFINHEGFVFRFQAGLSEQEQQNLADENASELLLSGALTQAFLGSIGYFWQKLQKGASPDIALCEVARDKLIAEVTSQVEQIQFLSQVRVRDSFTYSHILDVTALSIALAIKAGFSKQEVKDIALAAILHDLGKLMIPRNIMFKPGRLSEKEFEVMQLHPGIGYKMITEVLRLPDHIARPALEHQEMYNGGGYPQDLRGDQIHPYSHLVKIADVYDALTSKRPYKESIPSAKAIKIMLSEGDKSFHPELLAQFVKLSNYHDFSQEERPRIQELAS
ncbi:HD-GYP domain-containing protein [Vampirovibrio sp.]|uniref:HD-GYP domain-containing protein n=1 Tax=Vampirovibrio sp. TaxID=2717857 RepID=UPI0035934EB3